MTDCSGGIEWQAELQSSMQEREEWLTDIQCLRAKERRLYEDSSRLKADLERCTAELEGLRCRNAQLEKDNAELTEQNVQVRYINGNLAFFA